ncbi:MAG TPA: nuclear transport factor 2 family protein [Candidatus Acidoferrum sp.]
MTIIKFRLLLIMTVLLASIATTPSIAQQKSDAASKILALEAKWNEAYKRNDLATMNSLLADDFIITVEDGTTYSKSGYIANAGDGAMHVEISEMSNLKVNVHGNVAVVTGAYHEKGTLNGKPYEYRDRLTDVWINSDGKWQVIASHYSIPVKSN